MLFNYTGDILFTDPGADANWTVNVDWNGDGDFLDSGEGAFGVATHSFNINHTYGLADIGFTYNVVVQVDDNDGGIDTDIFQVTVLEDTLRVIDFETFASGFDVTFNRALDLTDLNLYDGNDLSIDLADLTVVGDTLGTINGSIAWNSTTNTLTWVKSGGVLGADDYTVTLISDSVAFKDTMGNLLDGDGDFNDSEVNDDYIDTFSVAVSSDRIVSLPDFARGAGQDVNVPTVEMGGLHLPISINQAAGVTSVDVDIVYDPALLNITGATLGSGPLGAGGWSLTQNPVSPGLLKLTISGTTALSGSNIQLIRLNADIPNLAPYADSQIIRLLNLEVNESVIPAKADYAVHKAAYVGDTDGNGVYLGSDAALISRVVVNLDSGFDAHDWTDPVIVGDTTGNGALSGQDASLVAQEAALIDTPEIPPLPMIGPLVAGTPGIDPELSVPNVFAAPGDEVTVPVTITVLPGEAAYPTVLSATFDVFFNNGSLALTTGDIAQGTFWDAGDNWSLTKNVIGGQARLVFFNSTPSDIGTGDIAYLTFTLDSGLTPGDVVNLNIQPVDPNEGNLTWTDVDGSIAVTYTADFEPDGDVDGDDLVTWQTGYGIVNTAAIQDGDADRDGDVDGRDFLAWQQQAGSTLFPLVATSISTDEASVEIPSALLMADEIAPALVANEPASATLGQGMWISSLSLGDGSQLKAAKTEMVDSAFAELASIASAAVSPSAVTQVVSDELEDTVLDCGEDETDLEIDYIQDLDEVFEMWS
ncbi:MAG: cohesin domain-containing protein [Bythopirellula sp.]|nr:cohesin domain-containing protein [Bythopirellula sp.]